MNWKGAVFMASPRINFCDTNVMSVCNATEKDLQKYCRFYDKSSHGVHCMFFHFEKYCDNLEAQKHALRLQMDKQQCLV
jgi:hypothetical protein